MTITLYGNDSHNTRKVRLTAAALGLDYTFTAVNLPKGEHKLPAHLARHPFGKVPALDDDGWTLFESGAICRYLAAGTDLYPDDKQSRAKIDQWMDFFTCHAGRWLATIWYERVLAPLFGRETNAANEAEALGFAQQQLTIVDAHLAENDYLAGGFSIADTFAEAHFETTASSKVSLADWPHILAWRARVQARTGEV